MLSTYYGLSSDYELDAAAKTEDAMTMTANGDLYGVIGDEKMRFLV